MMMPPSTSSDTCTMSVSATAFRPPYSAYASANSASAGDRDLQVDARDRIHRERAQPQDRGEIHEHVQREPEHGHDVAHGRAVTLLEELRHRVDAVLEEHRQDPLADDDQRERRHPFIGRDRHAHHVAGAGHADDLLGGDVRGDQRRADGPPGQRARGEEIILRALLVIAFLARHPLRQHEDEDRVDRDDRDIQSG